MPVLAPTRPHARQRRNRWMLSLDIGEASILWPVGQVDAEGRVVRLVNTGVTLSRAPGATTTEPTWRTAPPVDSCGARSSGTPRDDADFMKRIGWRFQEDARARAEEMQERRSRRLIQATARTTRLARLYLAAAVMPDAPTKIGIASGIIGSMPSGDGVAGTRSRLYGSSRHRRFWCGTN